MKKVLLDMDGVIVDFVGGVWKKYGLTHEYPPGDYDIIKATGLSITPESFWGDFGESFWADLEWTPEGKAILGMVLKLVPLNKVCLLTSPTLSPSSSSGKHLWINRETPELRRRFLIGSAKDMCAGPDSILIDDSDKNCEDFEAAGGKAILVPRRWNKGWTCLADVELEVGRQLESLLSRF